MAGDRPFTDYYRILQVDPTCDAKSLESAYRYLAKMYHPDHAEAADPTKLNEVIEAYRALRNPHQRAQYDLQYANNVGFPSSSQAAADGQSAFGDAEAHDRILMALYGKRRENAQDAGVIGFYLQEMLKCSDEHFEFHKWYLKEKGFITITEQGTLAITIQGVDHVISMSRGTRAEKLLIAQSDNPPD
jgi:curved DNA-binding protein